jgi:hypothetical protein
MGTIDAKVKLLNDREEQRMKMENDYEVGVFFFGLSYSHISILLKLIFFCR